VFRHRTPCQIHSFFRLGNRAPTNHCTYFESPRVPQPAPSKPHAVYTTFENLAWTVPSHAERLEDSAPQPPGSLPTGSTRHSLPNP